MAADGTACSTCGHFACVCSVKRLHDEDCDLRVSVTCPVGIECVHGYDVCPICDRCTCGAGDTAGLFERA